MKVLFLHGWQSVPGGVKPSYLRSRGCEVINPKLDDEDFAAAVRTAQAELDRHLPDVIVGSSRGGAVAMNLSAGRTPKVLLCPAWKKWGTARTVPPGTIILHSTEDEVIPYEHSVELAETSGATVIEVGKDHRLADNESLEVLHWACNIAASGEQLPMSDGDYHSVKHSSNEQASDPKGEASYVCDACGEEIVVPLDLTEGSSQMYIEDCPVCCRANIIHVEIDDEGNIRVQAEPEQDYE